MLFFCVEKVFFFLMGERYKNQKGNVLFLILIAVALFAALSYAITQSSRGGGDSGSEDARIQAARIIQYGTSIKVALDRMRIMNGVGENEISFYNETFTTMAGALRQPAGDFPNCGDVSCQIFHPDGGGATPIIFGGEAILVDSPVPGGGTAPGHTRFWEVDIENLGSSANDLAMSVLYLTPEVCMAVNDLLGIPNDGGAPPVDDYRPSGSYSDYRNNLDTLVGWTIGDDYAPFAGQTSFCTHWMDPAVGVDFDYVYYHVLIER